MRKCISFVTASAMLCAAISGCAKKNENSIIPLMGLEWFENYDDVRNELSDYELLDERENTESKISQKMLDYSDIELFGINCDLTLCFTDSGLIGFNYHDVVKNQDYRKWFSIIESNYGIPTESGNGMASWYDKPLGKNTAIYLFNLEEGVQISFYASADSPDKSYEKKQEAYIPAPEIRTPVVPVNDIPVKISDIEDITEEETSSAEIQESTLTEKKVYMTQYNANIPDENEDIPPHEEITETPEETTTVSSVQTATATTTTVPAETSSASTTTTTTTSKTSVTTTAVQQKPKNQPKQDEKKKAFLLGSLKFYETSNSAEKSMSAYKQSYKYRIEEEGQPWELIMEYENVPYLSRKCDAVLCFTSLGLVGISYVDMNAESYSYWADKLKNIYGNPDEKDRDYCAWYADEIYSSLIIYVFDLGNMTQISFFADDTGSELA